MAAHRVIADPRAAAPFEVLRFAVVAMGGDAALLELEGRFLPDAWPADHHPRLVVDGVDDRRLEVVPTTAVGGARDGSWRAGFAVPLAALDARGFALALPRLLVELPIPDVVGDGAPQLVRLAREANALRRDLDAALARAAVAEVPLAAAMARAEEQVVAARERARAELHEELAAARAQADQERARAAEERARMEQELATVLARAEEQIAGAHALGDERVAAVEAQVAERVGAVEVQAAERLAAAEAEAAEQLAALWEHVHAQNGAGPTALAPTAAAWDDDVPAVVPVGDDVAIPLAEHHEDPTSVMTADDDATVEAQRAGGAADVTVVRAPERAPHRGNPLPPPSAPPIPPDWSRPVVVAVLVLATLAFLLVLAGALS